MVRKILRYCIDVIIGMLVLVGLSITVLYFVVGWKPYIVESGSMESAIHTGSIVFVDTGYDFSDVEVDDVIAFTRVDGKAVTHRVVSMEDGLLETKGDANKVSDGFTTNEDNFIGKSIFSVPGLGYVSKTVYFDRMYTDFRDEILISERVSSRYGCSSVSVDGFSDSISGVEECGGLALIPSNNPFFEVNITFTNEKYENQYYSHNDIEVNEIKRNKTSMAVPE